MQLLANLEDFFGFVHKWFGVPNGSFALPASALPAKLPHSLEALYLQLGSLTMEGGPLAKPGSAPFNNQDCIYAPEQLVFADGQVEFASENQHNWSARCPATGADPAVSLNWGWMVESDTLPRLYPHRPIGAPLSDFLVTIGLQELVFHGHSKRRAIDPGGFAGARRNNESVPITDVPVWTKHNFMNCADWGDRPDNEPSHSFYMSKDGEILAFYQGDEPSGWYALRSDARR